MSASGMPGQERLLALLGGKTRALSLSFLSPDTVLYCTVQHLTLRGSETFHPALRRAVDCGRPLRSALGQSSSTTYNQYTHADILP